MASESVDAGDSLANLFRPLFDSGIKEIQDLLGEIRINKEKATNLGSFLLHHLILEKYMEDYILAVFPEIKRIDGHKVSFKDKLNILKKLNVLNSESYRAIEAINQIRNGLAHNINGREIKGGHSEAIWFIFDRWDNGGLLRQQLERNGNFYRTAEFVVYFLLVELLTGITLHGAKRNIEEEFKVYKEQLFNQLIGKNSNLIEHQGQNE